MNQKKSQIKSDINDNAGDGKFAVMFQSSPIGMSLSTFKEGRLLEVNESWLNLVGLNRVEDAIGKTTVDLGLVPDDETRDRILNEFNQSGYIENLEILSHIKNGSRKNLLVKKKMIQVSGVKYILSTIEDISERKLAEEKSAWGQMTFSELIEFAPFGIYVIDSAFRIARMNLGTQTGAFRNVRPLIGRDFSEAMHILWPDTIAEEVVEVFRQTLITGEPYYSPPFINQRIDTGAVESYEWELHRIMLPDGQYGVICYFYDSTRLRKAETALRESEEKYRTIVETANEGIWIVDENRKTTYVNQRMADMLGYTLEEMLTGQWNSFTFESEIPASEGRIYKRQIGLGIKESYEVKLKCKDGSELYTIVHATPQYDNDGKYLGSISLITDITELKNKEIALQENELKLRELIDTKDKFFNIIAHDLKNPFTSLIGSSELLADNIDLLGKDKIKALAQVINDASKNGYGILLNLLDWARSQTGMLDVIPERFNLGKLIEDQIRNLGHISTNKEIKIYSTVEKDIYITTDKNIVNTILRNLISNAVKFSNRQGKVNITVSQKNGSHIISVKDNGIGISPDKVKNIFRLETKLSTPGTENEQGTGLGLKLCKEFVEKIDGKIWVESVERKGSEFKFSIPVKEY
jgi:PAS domain S-box-containing protein